MEIDSLADGTLDVRSVRRLIAVEVGDIDVPAMPGPTTAPRPPILYFRVVESAERTARIELWERGSFYGTRTISATRSPRLWPRRIALAAAELARRLKHRRIAEARRLVVEQQRKLALEEAARRTPPFARSAFVAGFDGAWSSSGDLWLFGPRLGTEVRFGSGFRLSAAASWRHGQIAALTPAPLVQWIEIEGAPGFALPLVPDLELIVDFPLAASLVRLGDGASTDGVTIHAQSWSARAGVAPRVERRFGDFRLGLGPVAGLLLHPVRVLADHGGSTVVGGMWVGGALSFVLDPNARP